MAILATRASSDHIDGSEFGGVENIKLWGYNNDGGE